ncbi:MATE family efflux transporter [Erysipelothrix amsterdamensis]|uniref:Multidrug export protein MepA n=1 Tax=Erysipelothrix amsterdamensis TaxID=2929157 RepID=A0AAU9VKR4_9FIRM|nr:MATE family efflux transporter [Erysipelothrix sp. A18Y020d]CAH2763329.1 MATE family efflux transporter [Erysipelothrix sp. A18Y020d]
MNTIPTRKQLRHNLARYILPSIGAMIFFSLYTMVDGMFVGKGVGPHALASVNLSMPYINMIFAFALMIAVGASTRITYYFGKKSIHESNVIFSLGFWFLGLFSLALAMITGLLRDSLIILLGATPDTMHYVSQYLSMMILFSPFFMLTYYLEVLVKADGAPGLSLLGIILSAFVNIVLDYLFVIQFQWGIQGAALATGIAQVFGFIFFLTYFLSSKSTLKFIKPTWNIKTVMNMIRIGIPDALTELSSGFITFVFNLGVAFYFGSNGLAAFGVLMYLTNLVTVTMIGINQGIQPLISFYHGQKQTKLMDWILNDALFISVLCGLGFFILCQTLPEVLVSGFINVKNIEPFNLAVKALPIFSYGFLLSGINIVLAGYFTALERIRPAMLISMMRGYLLVALCVISLPYLFGASAIWLAPLTYELLTLVVSLILFKHYKKTA